MSSITSENVSQLSETIWDAVIIGTGIGGSTVGHALARFGLKVLFCEQGYTASIDEKSLRGVYAESFFQKSQPREDRKEILRQTGRYSEEILANQQSEENSQLSFYPYIGEGAGGSSALFGMVMERFKPEDFSSGLWPIQAEQLRQYYEEAEMLYQVRQGADLPPLTSANTDLWLRFERLGLHPRRLPLACGFETNCHQCQNFLCRSNCKKHAGNMCLRPAIEQHGASLVTDCKVKKLEAEHKKVNAVHCCVQGKNVIIKGKIIILAAGALNTPVILLRSKSELYPQGLGNSSGLVGRNLMRHYIDLYAVKTGASSQDDRSKKQICIHDFISRDGIKLGVLQSFGLLPPSSVIAQEIEEDIKAFAGSFAAGIFRLTRPLAQRLIDRKFADTTLLATIMEDESSSNNYVAPSGPDGAGPISIHYNITNRDRNRIEELRKIIKELMHNCRYDYMSFKQAENNKRLAHICGTCRFGDDPSKSVLDSWNKSHDIDNLYIVDSSFFPTSGTVNPALTIAANALRVAKHIIEKME